MVEPPSSFRDKSAQRLDAEADEILNAILEAVKGNGTVRRRFACQHCGQPNDVEVTVATVKDLVEAAKFLDDRGHGKLREPAPSKTVQPDLTLEALERLTDAELEQIAQGAT